MVLIGLHERLYLSKTQLHWSEVRRVCRSELVYVAIVSHQISDMRHLVGAVVVYHNEFGGPRSESRQHE